ncbi:MAG: hypothetical protein AB1607_05500 [Chloroflexota bacterium]
MKMGGIIPSGDDEIPHWRLLADFYLDLAVAAGQNLIVESTTHIEFVYKIGDLP